MAGQNGGGPKETRIVTKFLRSRPDVDPDRIGGFGFSIGGEMLLEAAAQSNGFKAIVSEGAQAAASETKTCRAQRGCFPSQTWP